jgi:hypothetical protein
MDEQHVAPFARAPFDEASRLQFANDFLPCHVFYDNLSLGFVETHGSAFEPVTPARDTMIGRRGARLVRVIPMLLVCLGAASASSSQTSTGTVRPRTIVTTDPELDDSNSLVRYLLYSADLQTEGLI